MGAVGLSKRHYLNVCVRLANLLHRISSYEPVLLGKKSAMTFSTVVRTLLSMGRGNDANGSAVSRTAWLPTERRTGSRWAQVYDG